MHPHGTIPYTPQWLSAEPRKRFRREERACLNACKSDAARATTVPDANVLPRRQPGVAACSRKGDPSSAPARTIRGPSFGRSIEENVFAAKRGVRRDRRPTLLQRQKIAVA